MLTVSGHVTATSRVQDRSMVLLPTPAVIERRMDDQSVLARRAPNAGVARMHEDLAALYREQLIAVMRASPAD